MKTSELLPLLRPFIAVLNKNSMTPIYRTLCIDKTSIRGCSGWAMVEVSASLGIVEPILIDAVAFIAVMSSLPNDDIVLNVSEGVLLWTCGTAKGKLALIKGDFEIPKITRRAKPDSLAIPKSLSLTLDLGSISCGASSLESAGLYGVVLDNRNNFVVRSSDDVTVASASEDFHISYCPKIMTISPDACKLLSMLCKQGGTLEFDEATIYYRTLTMKVVINQKPPLKHDLAELAQAFSQSDISATIPRDRIESFVRRATALSEDNKRTFVVLSASNGQLGLSFADGAAATEEYYLVEGLEVPDMQQITVDALRMSRVLEHANEVVMDHMDRGVLVFQNKKEDATFQYIISGKR